MARGIVYFGSGSPLSVLVFRQLAARHRVEAVVVPPQRRSVRETVKRWLGRSRRDGLAEAASTAGIETFAYAPDTTARLIRSLDAELVVVATFPRLLPLPLIASARGGGVNLHQSLLPRLRGPDPLFWSYYDDERETGSTVHWLDAGFDSGDIIAQETVPIARGQSIVDLYFTLAGRGAKQLSDAIDAIFDGSDSRRPQDESQATSRPSPLKTPWRVQFDQWGAERTWHFISGTAPIFGGMFRDPAGTPLPAAGARRFTIEAHGREPGSRESADGGWRLFCRDGTVDVDSPAPA